MKDKVKQPKNLKKAFKILDKAISKEDMKTFRETEYDDLIMWHHTLGQWIRNRFYLWRNKWESPMLQWFEKNMPDLDHPDDMSQHMIEKYWIKLNS